MRSSNIAAIYDVVEYNDTTFIVMEYVAGEQIGARIARGPLPVRDVVQIGMQAADALDEAHAHGVIHRDIKSANLIVDQRGRVKLLDFGLAKLVPGGDGADAMTQTAGLETVAGTVMGTFAYMSPEQVRGRPVDFRSDLFSLGVVLYEMLTARLPFEGSTITEVIDGVMNHEPQALGRFNYNIPAELERVVLKLLAKDRGLPVSVGARTLHRPERDRAGARSPVASALARAAGAVGILAGHGAAVAPAAAYGTAGQAGQAASTRARSKRCSGRRRRLAAWNGSRAKAPARSPSRAPTAARAAWSCRRCSRRSGRSSIARSR